MDNFSIGDLVEVLDETISGRVVGIQNEQITLATVDGFEMVFESSQLIPASKNIQVSNYEAARIKHEKEA